MFASLSGGPFGRETSASKAIGLLLLFTGARLILALRFPLAPDETYYWEWSRRLDWGYYDQGPMVAWWIRAGCLLFGETPLGIRAGTIAAAAITQWFVFLLGRDLFSPRAGLAALVLAGITPLAVAGGIIATYDPLMVLFWAGASYFAARALIFGDSSSWLWLGLTAGLGMLSKHTTALLLPSLLLFLALPSQRFWLRRREPWLALLAALAVYAPNLWWQSRHGWVTFEHLFVLSGKGTDHGFARRLGDFAGSQIGLLTPILFLALLAALVWAGRKGWSEKRERLWLLFCLSAPSLLFFLAMTAKSKVQANWAIAGWLTPPLLMLAWMEEGVNRRRLAWTGIATCAALSILLVQPEARAALGIRIAARLDQMNKLYGGPELAAAAAAEMDRMRAETGATVRVGSTTYDHVSRLAFYLPGKPYACCLFLGTRPNSYQLWEPRGCPEPGDNMLISDDHAPQEAGRPPFEAVFERVEPADRPIPVYRRGVYDEPVHVYYLYRCYNYRGGS